MEATHRWIGFHCRALKKYASHRDGPPNMGASQVDLVQSKKIVDGKRIGQNEGYIEGEDGFGHWMGQ
jgi:hypothetical protein